MISLMIILVISIFRKIDGEQEETDLVEGAERDKRW